MRRFLVVLICIGILSSICVSPVSAYYTNMSATVVLGQPDFVSGSVNQGGSSPTASTLNSPNGIIAYNGQLFVVDQTNNRILIWNSIPTRNNTPADVVLGQPDFVSNTANNGGISASTLTTPNGVFVDNGRLLITDTGNHRILIWNSIPTRNNTPADVVLGQPDFVTSSAGITASKFNSPSSSFTVYQGKLIFSDAQNRRILIYNQVPTANSAPADVVIGQTNMTTNAFGGVDARHFGSVAGSGPRGVTVSGGKLAIFDFVNSRVLIYNQIPTSNGAAADAVIGQPDFISSATDNGGVSCASILSSGGLYSNANGRLFIADDERLLIFNSFTMNVASAADIVLGQSSCSTRSSGTSANLFSTRVRGVAEYGNQLFVTDSSNNRVLIFPNTLITPPINITTPPISIGSGKYRLTGNVFMNNNNNTYGLETLSADLNGVGYSNVTFPGGRTDTGGNTTYDFNYDFDPTVGNGSINNLTIKLLASTYNADTSTLFYFLPFNFSSFNVSNTKSQNFTFSVNKDQLQRIKDNLDHFEVSYKPNTTKGVWTTYISNIGKDKIDASGVVVATKTNGIKFIGSYIFKITAIDNWGNKEDSNYLYIAGTNPITLTSYPSFGKSFVSPAPSSTPSLIAVTQPILPANTPAVIPTSVPEVTDGLITNTNGVNKLYIILVIPVVGFILLLLFVFRRRKKTEV